MGKRRIKITVCNVPIQISGDVLAAYSSEYGDVEDVTTTKSISGRAYRDFFFTMCLNRGGFQAIPYTLDYEDEVMIVVVEGKKTPMLELQTAGPLF